jgi:hypothetical protein
MEFLSRIVSFSRKWVLVTLPTPGVWGRIYRGASRIRGTRISLFTKREMQDRYGPSIVHLEDVGLKSPISGGMTLICLISATQP